MRILEYNGLDLNNPFDIGTTAYGSGATANSGSVNTNSASELIIGAGLTTQAYSGPGSGFSSRVITSPDNDISEDQICKLNRILQCNCARLYWIIGLFKWQHLELVSQCLHRLFTQSSYATYNSSVNLSGTKDSTES